MLACEIGCDHGHEQHERDTHASRDSNGDMQQEAQTVHDIA